MKTLTFSESANWEQLCDDTSLENIPYRVELSQNGRLIMSPHRSYHSIFQSRIIRWLNHFFTTGDAMPECPIQTDNGVMVADVAWASSEKVERNFNLATWSGSPEIVVEVLSPSNSEDEIAQKRAAVFDKGAVEFWLCDQTGKIEFFGQQGRLNHSTLCPKFPSDIAKNPRP